MKSTMAFAVLLLAGCASNPVRTFYRSDIGDKTPSSLPGFQDCDGEPGTVSSGNIEKDAQELVRQGFVAMGHSSFTGPAGGISESNVLEVASDIGACRVLTSAAHTEAPSRLLWKIEKRNLWLRT